MTKTRTKTKTKPPELISLSGKKGSGKDLVASLIQYQVYKNYAEALADNDPAKEIGVTYERWLKEVADYHMDSTWQIKKFADKLKDIVCLLIGCTREDLESQEFKNKPLGDEWAVFYLETRPQTFELYKLECELPKMYILKEAAQKSLKIIEDAGGIGYISHETMTPRKLLQILGTECGREIINPEIWVNALFADYKGWTPKVHSGKWNEENCYMHKSCTGCGEEFYGYKRQWMCKPCVEANSPYFPKWIVTDTRFPNEIEAIESRNGIKIKIVRLKTSEQWQEDIKHMLTVYDPDGWNRDHRYQFEWYEEKITLDEFMRKTLHSTCLWEDDYMSWSSSLNHASETSLDSYEDWDYIIINDGTIEELEAKVRAILQEREII